MDTRLRVPHASLFEGGFIAHAVTDLTGFSLQRDMKRR
jgi:hypothetical protein